MDYQQILKDIYQEIQPYASIGKHTTAWYKSYQRLVFPVPPAGS